MTGSVLETTGSVLEATGSALEARGSALEARGSALETTGSVFSITAFVAISKGAFSGSEATLFETTDGAATGVRLGHHRTAIQAHPIIAANKHAATRPDTKAPDA